MSTEQARTHLDLFSGIGGISLASHWAGFRTVAFCEKESFCRAVLRKNFGAESVIFDDIHDVTAESLRGRGVEWPYLLSGGFPCQDISVAGAGAGLSGDRSGLWFAMLRVIRDVGPRFCLIENVPNLKNKGIDVVLDGLGEAGYACWAGVVGAESAGAPHRRNRVFIVAHAGHHDGQGWLAAARRCEGQSCGESAPQGLRIGAMAHPDGHPPTERGERAEDAPCRTAWRNGGAGGGRHPGQISDAGAGQDTRRAGLADADGAQRRASARRWEHDTDGDGGGRQEEAGRPGLVRPAVADAYGAGSQELRLGESGAEELCASERGCPAPRWPARPGQPQRDWEAPRTVEPPVGGTTPGLSRRLVRDRRDALKAYGNCVVPAQVYPVLRAIAEYEARK